MPSAERPDWCGFAGGRFWRVKRRSDTRLRSVAIGTVAHQGLPKEAAQPLADPSGCSGGEGRRYAFVSLCRPGRTCQVRGKGKPLGDAWPKWFGRYLRLPLVPFHAEGCAGVQGGTTAHARCHYRACHTGGRRGVCFPRGQIGGAEAGLLRCCVSYSAPLSPDTGEAPVSTSSTPTSICESTCTTGSPILT